MRAFTPKLLIAILVVVLSGGCTGHGPDQGVAVRAEDNVLASFTVAQLVDLPQVEIVTPQSRGAQVQHGPPVRAVLHAAGATGVRSLRVEGRDPAQTLTAGELTDQVILSVTKRGTLKLAGASLDRARWVRDVTALVVNP